MLTTTLIECVERTLKNQEIENAKLKSQLAASAQMYKDKLEQIKLYETELEAASRKQIKDQETMGDLENKLTEERKQRVYYQGMLYYILNVLDQLVGKKLVVGTIHEPSNQAQQAIDEVAKSLHFERLEADKYRAEANELRQQNNALSQQLKEAIKGQSKPIEVGYIVATLTSIVNLDGMNIPAGAFGQVMSIDDRFIKVRIMPFGEFVLNATEVRRLD